MTLKISISGVRGVVPESLTPEVCLNFAKAFGSYIIEEESSPNKTIVVGTDPRSSSEFIKGIVFSGLLSTGCKIVDLGICPTPTVGIMVRKLKAAGGIVITASHNPLPWNGLKFMREDGIFLNENQAKKLIDLYEKQKFIKKKQKGVVADPSGIDIHIKKILKVINPFIIKRRKFKVVIDCCNGAGGIAAVKLLKKLGCKVFPINCDLTLPFAHAPEPIAKNLTQLMKTTVAKKADIGFALDSDADRLAIVSSHGKPIGEELTLALATQFVLLQNHNETTKKKIVITNLSTTQAIDDIVRSYHGIVIRTKIGEVHVAQELKHLKALIGGEGNGGVIYPPVGFNRDALAAMTLILKLMATTKKSIADLVSTIPTYFMIKKKIKCKSQHEAEVLISDLKERFPKKALILTDGVKVMLAKSWVHIRASNTEPVIRIIAEGKERRKVKKLIKQALKPLS
ncbi:MAG: phosphoglucosamine mutase [Candidatus Saganbacteria bacterium]|nr:phosphoglucosamine mutase [Candidatus Saganbacteria bacterium]